MVIKEVDGNKWIFKPTYSQYLTHINIVLEDMLSSLLVIAIALSL